MVMVMFVNVLCLFQLIMGTPAILHLGEKDLKSTSNRVMTSHARGQVVV